MVVDSPEEEAEEAAVGLGRGEALALAFDCEALLLIEILKKDGIRR